MVQMGPLSRSPFVFLALVAITDYYHAQTVRVMEPALIIMNASAIVDGRVKTVPSLPGAMKHSNMR